MNSYNHLRHMQAEAARLALIEEALLCRLRGHEPTGAAAAYMCDMRTLEILCSGSAPGSGVHLAGTVGDFPLMLGNVLSKRVLDFYALENPAHRRLSKPVSLADFRPTNIGLTEFPRMAKVDDHGEFKSGVLGDSGDAVVLETWGSILPLTRQAVLADDAGALDDVARAAAQAALLAEADLFFNVLLSNGGLGPVMRDGVKLFDAAGHGNLMAGALDEGNLGVAIGLLRQQQTIGGGRMSLGARALLVGPVLEVTASKLLAMITPGSQSPLELVVDARLGGSQAWYLLADPMTRPALIFGHLADEGAPTILSRAGFYSDGLEFRASSDFAAGAVDWRPIVRSTGV